MNRQSDRVAKMETKAFPPPDQQVRIGFRMEGDAPLPYPADIGSDDMFITIVGIAPAQSVSP